MLIVLKYQRISYKAPLSPCLSLIYSKIPNDSRLTKYYYIYNLNLLHLKMVIHKGPSHQFPDFLAKSQGTDDWDPCGLPFLIGEKNHTFNEY